MSDLYLIAAGLAVVLILLLVIDHYRGEIAKLRAAIKFQKMRGDAFWKEIRVLQAAENKRREQRLAASAKAAAMAAAKRAAA